METSSLENIYEWYCYTMYIFVYLSTQIKSIEIKFNLKKTLHYFSFK